MTGQRDPYNGSLPARNNEVMGLTIGRLIVSAVLFFKCPRSKILNLNIEFDI